MGLIDTDTLVGELEIVERPRELAWSKPLDFVKMLVKMLRVKFPVSRNNNFVISGDDVPGTDETGKMWAKFDAQRNPLGWWAFAKGKWRKFFTVGAGEVKWFIGDSSKPEDGWSVITGDNAPGISSGVLSKLLSMYVEITPGVYSYYAARYVGFSEGE